MARVDPTRELTLSVLDQLLDDDPDVRTDPARGSRPLLRELRAAVRRDLENLLNTRRSALVIPPDLQELGECVLTYGMPDMTGADLASKSSRVQFVRSVEELVRRCEPRFKTVKVELVESADPLDRVLRFKIEALLWALPMPELVAFDSELEPMRRTFAVRSGS